MATPLLASSDRARCRDILGLSSLFAAIYFIQGVCEPTEGLIAQPVRSLLRQWGHSAGEITTFSAWLAAPWAIKPLYGLLTDFLPLAGSRRRSYLLLANAATAIMLLVFCWYPPEIGISTLRLFTWLLIPTIGVAFADVVVDALMVEKGQPLGATGTLQSVQWSAMYTATILTGYVGGWLSERSRQETGFLIAGVCAAVAFVLTWLFVHDHAPPRRRPGITKRPRKKRSSGKAIAAWLRGLLRPSVLIAAAFLFLWNYNPFSTSVLYMYMTQQLKLGDQFYGETVSWQAVGSVCGCIAYGFYCRRVPFRHLVHVSILAGILATLAYWGLRGTWSGRVISVFVGFTYLTGSLVQLDFAARACARDAAGTTFALLMAISNLSVSLSMGMGGWLYEWWGAQGDHALAFHALVGLGALATAACWLLTPWLMRAVRETQAGVRG